MARTNLQIKVGTYTGNGVDSTNISGIGFRPQLVIIKGGANATVIRTKEMRGDKTAYLGTNVGNLSDAIQELLADGFQVGTNAVVNAAATVYYYIAIRGVSGQSNFRTGRYIGSGVDSRNFTVGGLNFTPDIAIIAGDIAANKVFRLTSHVGDDSSQFTGTINAADLIQNLQTNGFQLGADNRVNGSGTEYFFTALKALAGVIAYGSYVGDGVDNRNITGLGFQPDFVLIKQGDAANQCRMRTSSQTGDDTLRLGTAASGANEIQQLSSDGFQLGTSASVNNVASTHYWFAFKAGDHNAPIIRTVA